MCRCRLLKCVVTVNCMWRSRMRATFLSNRDEVYAGDEPTITHKPTMTYTDCYRLVFNFQSFYFQFAVHFLSVRAMARHTLLQFSVFVLAGANCKCVWLLGWHFYSLFSINCFSSSLLGKTVWYLLAKICWFSFGRVILTNVSFFCLQSTIPIVRFSSLVFLNSS